MAVHFRKGTLADTEMFIHFLDDIKAGMVQKDWFCLDPPETVRKMMADGTMELWLAMDGERIAAAFDILHPGLASFNYGYDLGFSEEELMQVVHMDTSAVGSDYRGMGLQRKMVQIAEETLSGQGRKILLCTVHPENRYSMNNMLKQGYEIQKQVPKYGSERYILRKNIFQKM